MARARCRVLGVSSIQNLAETKARSAVSRQQARAFRSYSVLRRKETMTSESMIDKEITGIHQQSPRDRTA